MDPSRDAGAEQASPLRRPKVAGDHSAAPPTLILSDVRLYGEGLALALEARGDVEVVATAGSLEAAQSAISAGRWPVVLLDVGMANAFGIARALMRNDPAPKIIALAVANEAADVVACARAGCDGYVPRDAAIADVAMAIRSAILGELRCSPRITATLFKRLALLGPIDGSTDAPPLTARESEVLALIDRGLSNKEIAQRLRIGAATVKNHVHNILEKLHVNRRAEAAAHARARSNRPEPSFNRRTDHSPTDQVV
jgi:DNA-binding NarL/FixJ family response regulator